VHPFAERGHFWMHVDDISVVGSSPCNFYRGTQCIILLEAFTVAWTRAAYEAAETGHHWMQFDKRGT
jgi:hypothetical protein